MSEITIKHYLNKKLKPYFNGFENQYPVYVRIINGREVIRIKSVIANKGNKLFDYLTDDDLKNPDNIKLFEIEAKIIKYIFENLEKYINDVGITISDIIKSFIDDVILSFYNAIFIEFDEEINKFENKTLSDNFSFSFKKFVRL